MTFQSHQALESSGSFADYPALAESAVSLLPTAGPIFAVAIIIGLSVFRIRIMNKQDKAEEKGKISADDKSKYSPQNSKDTTVSSDATVSSSNTTVSSSNTTVSPSNNTSVSSTDTGGNNPETDYHRFLERYIDDLYKAGTEGDNILREAGLGRLVDNN
jgi:hypothetical protein